MALARHLLRFALDCSSYMRFGSPKASTSSALPQAKPPLSFADVANLIVRARRLTQNNQNNTTKTSKPKSHHITSESGGPQTHPDLAGEGVTSVNTVPVAHTDIYTCSGAVDAEKLLRATRNSVYAKAVEVGANVLIEEEWTCTISGPKHRSNGTFRVHIHYTAHAARAGRPDPKIPPALANIKSVEGLMFIEKRESV